MRFIANAILIIFLITFIDGCKDDDPTLPPITSTGAGTFGCLIDGKVFVPRESLPWVDVTSDMIVVYKSQNGASFILKVRDLNNPIVANHTYYFKGEKDISCMYSTWSDNSSCHYEDVPVSGSITFSKINYESHVISGTFEFTAFSSDCNKSVTITEGRFDIRTDI
jgi:hypothetical protein